MRISSETARHVLSRMAMAVVVPSIPVMVWWKYAVDDRKAKAEEVRTKVRVPNVQTVDDLLVEKCKPGDIILFDRRCEKCAAGPTAALSCLLGKSILCGDKAGQRSVEAGEFEHCGIVVPGMVRSKKDELDPSNLLLLEATSGNGIVARPLLTRLEMSQSRTVMLLPLSAAGERRGDDNYEPSEKTTNLNNYVEKQLAQFRDQWVELGEQKGYKKAHSTLGIFGALAYSTGLSSSSKAPVSPSAWLCVSALQFAGVGENLSDRTVMETKVEDFLRDYRFQEKGSVRLRPGWKFLPPVPMREANTR